MYTKHLIGVKNIKTPLAVFISVFISNLAHLEFPFFTAIAAIFTIENPSDRPIAAGKTRAVGTLVGALTGLGLVFVKPGSLFLIALGMMVLIFICNIFKWDKAIPIAGVVFLAIMLGKDIKNPLQYTIGRVFNTIAGIGIAVLVDYLIPGGGKRAAQETK